MSEDNIDQIPSKAVGMFEDHGVQIYVFTKKGETPEEAIERVAKNHHIPANKVTKVKK